MSRTCRPVVEALEDRCVPTISVFQAPGSNLLLITGTEADDVVRITDTGSSSVPGAVSVRGTGLAGVFRSFAPPVGQVLQVQIVTGGGNDLVFYSLRGDLTSRFTATAFNSAALSPLGFSGTSFSTGGSSLFPFGTLVPTPAPLSTTLLSTPSIFGTSTILGGRIINANLGRGDDTFILDADQDVDILADSTLTVNVNGSFGADRINLGFQGTVSGNLALTGVGGLGVFNDAVAVQQTINAGSTGRASAQVFGGPGNDRLLLFIDRRQSDLLFGSTGQVFGGTGFNTGLFTPGVTATGVVQGPTAFSPLFMTVPF